MFFWALGATVVLVAVGIVGILLNQGRITWLPDEIPVVTPAPSVEPVKDTTYSVLVLNGTEEAGLATSTRDQLIAAGWTQDLVIAGNASESTVVETIVYFTVPEAEAAALGLAEVIGAAGVQLDPEYPIAGTPATQLTVVLGSGASAAPTPSDVPEG